MLRGGGGRIFIILGVVVAFIVAIGVFVLANSVAPTKIITKPVVVAVKDIPEKTLFTEANVKTLLQVQNWQQETVPVRALTRPEEAIGKLNSVVLFQGQPVVATALTGTTEGKTGLSVDLPRGMVAYAIPMSDLGAVAGAVLPGDHVDVLWSEEVLKAAPTDAAAAKPNAPAPRPVAPGAPAGTPPSGEAIQPIQHAVITIFQDVQVLAVGGTTNAPQSKTGGTVKSTASGSITFLLSHQDANLMKWFSEKGKLDLALRRFDDRAIVDTTPVLDEFISARYKITFPAAAASGSK